MLKRLFGFGDRMSSREYKEYFGDKPRSIDELHTVATQFAVLPMSGSEKPIHLGDNIYLYKGDIFTRS